MIETSNYMWLLDPGHGGINPIGWKYETPGAKQYTFEDGFWIPEGFVNRQVAYMLHSMMKAKGYDSTMVPHQVFDTPLNHRINTVNAISSGINKPCILISIHSNAANTDIEGPSVAARGFEIYTSPGDTPSDPIAEVFAHFYKNEFLENENQVFKFRADESDGDADKEARFAMLTKTKCPAILVENLFYQNHEQAMMLMSYDFQMRIAYCLYNAILYVEQNNVI